MIHDTYKQNRAIINYLKELTVLNKFNRFVTISFVHSKYGTPLRKSDTQLTGRLIQTYLKEVSEKLNGKPRKSDSIPKRQVPALAFPEYKSKSSDCAHLHFHILAEVPETQIRFFEEVTEAFWKRVCKKDIGYVPQIDHRPAYDPSGAVGYILKNIEDQFTIENTFHSRLSLT